MAVFTKISHRIFRSETLIEEQQLDVLATEGWILITIVVVHGETKPVYYHYFRKQIGML